MDAKRRTDIFLKRLTVLRGADLLPLLGMPAAALVRVETHELPATGTRLDTIMRVRSPQGREYLHIIEWQGYHDPAVLWRLAGYMTWFGQRDPTTPIVGSVVYLAPTYDMGDTLQQVIDGQVVQQWQLHAVRLWQYDARDAAASGEPGLVALSPLMDNADAALVEGAANTLLRITEPPLQNDLLNVLGAFGIPFVSKERFVQLITKERLMASELFDYLMQEREAELIAKVRAEVQAEAQAEVQAMQATIQTMQTMLQQTVVGNLLARFPAAPPALLDSIAQVRDPQRLSDLNVAVQRVPDLAAYAQLVAVARAAEAREPDGDDAGGANGSD